MEEVLNDLKEQIQRAYQTAYVTLVSQNEGAVALRVHKEMNDAVAGISSIKKKFMDI